MTEAENPLEEPVSGAWEGLRLGRGLEAEGFDCADGGV